MAAILVEDPINDKERGNVASACVKELNLPMRAVIDRIDDKTGAAYSAWPDRLYLVGKDGKIAYAGGRGPFGFKPDELEESIIEELGKIWKRKHAAKGK